MHELVSNLGMDCDTDTLHDHDNIEEMFAVPSRK